MRRALTKAGIRNPLMAVQDGVEAMNYIEGKVFFSDRDRFPLPELILLDLKMPRVMDWNFSCGCGGIPRAGISRSSCSLIPPFDPDIQKAYALGANSFLFKPHELTVFADALKQVVNAWTNRGQMPCTAPFSPSPEAGRTDLRL